MRRRMFTRKIGVGAVALALGISGCREFVGQGDETTIPLSVTNYDGRDRTLTVIWRDEQGERGRRTVKVPAKSRVPITEIDASNSVVVELPSGFHKGGGPFRDATSGEIYLAAGNGVQILPSKSG